MEGRYVLGVDGGTEGLRAGLFDLAGTPLAFAATPYETRFPQPGLSSGPGGGAARLDHPPHRTCDSGHPSSRSGTSWAMTERV